MLILSQSVYCRQIQALIICTEIHSQFLKWSEMKSLSCVQLFATPWTTARQASLSFSISQSLLKLMLLSRWCHPTISSSVAPFSSCPQSFPASGSFPVSRLFTSSGQSIRASASTSVLIMNIQLVTFRIDWFDLLMVQGTLKDLLQHYSSKASILRHSAFFMVQLSHLLEKP